MLIFKQNLKENFRLGLQKNKFYKGVLLFHKSQVDIIEFSVQKQNNLQHEARCGEDRKKANFQRGLLSLSNVGTFNFQGYNFSKICNFKDNCLVRSFDKSQKNDKFSRFPLNAAFAKCLDGLPVDTEAGGFASYLHRLQFTNPAFHIHLTIN